jgi:1,2-phenylacetyl-CoA epoxidase catalytic subunit
MSVSEGLTGPRRAGDNPRPMRIPAVDDSLSTCEPRYRETCIQMMRSQAYRELAAAHLFGHGLQFCPDLQALRFISGHIQEETEHYGAVAKIYREHLGESIEPWVHARLAEKPIPMAESYLELAVAQWLYDRGGFWQLREYVESSWAPYREIVGQIVSQEEGHQDHGEAIAVPLIRAEKDRALAQALFDKWLRLGLLCLGRPHSEGNRYALSVGLKKRDSAECLKDYVADIAPAVAEAGLAFPPRESLGVELPLDIRWPG